MHAHTTARVITSRGRGAVATVSLVGDCSKLDVRPLFRAANGRAVSEQHLERIVFGQWGSDPCEDVVLCRTSDTAVEIHCHGGDAAVTRILNDLQHAGCSIVSWNVADTAQQTLEEECSEALIHATTLRTAAILLDQQSGSLLREVDALRQGNWESASRESLAARLDELLSWADFGKHLTQPWQVVLAGRPNVGKSSLINALVGFSRSIVHDRPGTTRDVVTAETALDGWPIRLADTAGIRENAESIEAAGIDLAQQQMAAADCRLLIIDRASPPTLADRTLLSNWPDALVVANKVDLPDVWGDKLPADCLTVSAINSRGIEALSTAIVARLVPRPPSAGQAMPFTERQVALLTQAQEALRREDRDAFQGSIKDLVGPE